MINAIVGFAIKQRVAIVVLTLFLLGLGVWQAVQLPIDSEPDVTNVQVVVSALDPALGPQELEQRVTFPLEQALAGMAHLDRTESISQYGLSQVTCYFDEKTDIYTARSYVNERLQNVQGQLPDGINATMLPATTGVGEILHVRIAGGPMSLMERRSYADWVMRPQLLQVPGIADVNVLGGKVRQWQVSADPQKLAARGLSVGDVGSALAANNANIGGSFLNQGPVERIVRGIGFLQSLDDVRQVVVGAQNGVPVMLAQVADVKEGPAPAQGSATSDGQGETVIVLPLLRVGANTQTTMQGVKAKLATLSKGLPPGTHFEQEFDRTALTKSTLDTVIHNLVEGGVLVVVILFLFLLQLRAGFIVSAIIPLSMMVAIIGMSVFHISANLMSLGAIDFGMIVDGAVIIVENSVRRLAAESKDRQDGKKLSDDERHDIIQKAAAEVLTPSVWGITIILATYLPVLTLTSIEGKLFKPMALTVMFALTGSLLLSLTLIPALCTFFLKAGKQPKNKPLEWLTDRYASGLDRAIKHKWVTVGLALAFVAVSFFSAGKLGSEFVPTLEENNIDISVYYDPSIDLPQMLDRSTLVEKVLMQHFPNEIAHVLTRIGRSYVPTDAMLQSQGDIMIQLKDRSQWTDAKDQKELTGKITKVVDELPGFSTDYTQPIQSRMFEMIYGQGQTSDFGVKVFGPDLNVIRQQAAKIAAVVQTVPNAQDVKVQTTTGLPQLVLTVNRQAAARYGISVADVNTVIDSAIGTRTATMGVDGSQQIEVTVRLASADRQTPEQIRRILVPGPHGLQIPLSEVASIQNMDGPVEIDRENEQRRIMVNANVGGNDLGGFVKAAQQKIKSQVHLPPGYTLAYGGEYESLQSGRSRLALVVPIALTAILALLLIVFGRMRQALMIFTGIPLAISGGILALLLRHLPFSMTGAVGFIALGGIALLNGIVMLSFINDLRRQGKTVKEAVEEGARERLRPVLMTGTVATIGFIPMAVSTGLGAEVQRPLATVVIGGLITSTLLTLFVLPTLYSWFEHDDDGKHKKRRPRKHTKNSRGHNGYHAPLPEDHELVPAEKRNLVLKFDKTP